MHLLDDQLDFGKTKKLKRKSIKDFDEDSDENRGSFRQKRSGKRFHRKKTLKDEFWIEDDDKRRSKH